MPPYLTASELKSHPEYPHIIWPLPATQSGRFPSGASRGSPYNIAYELHGTGPTHILFIMGLGGLRSAWQRQNKDFGHTQADKYSTLCLDNVGVGESDKPFGRYSTSNMAKDCLELLDHVGWTGTRSVHVVGVSMGGMIAQELGLLDPERVASLTLLSTAARLQNTVGFLENLQNRVKMFVPKSMDETIAHARGMIYTESFLSQPDELEYTKAPFPTNGDRFGASELWKREQPGYFTRAGFIGQAIAAGWHHKSKAQLRELGDKVGRGRIMVVHGTEDKMLTPPHGEVLAEELGEGVRKEIFRGQGHVIPIEKRREFNELLAGFIGGTEKLG